MNTTTTMTTMTTVVAGGTVISCTNCSNEFLDGVITGILLAWDQELNDNHDPIHINGESTENYDLGSYEIMPLIYFNFRSITTKQDLSDAVDHPCMEAETIDFLEHPFVASISYINADRYEVSYMFNGTIDYFNGIVHGLTQMEVEFHTDGILELSDMRFHEF